MFKRRNTRTVRLVSTSQYRRFGREFVSSRSLKCLNEIKKSNSGPLFQSRFSFFMIATSGHPILRHEHKVMKEGSGFALQLSLPCSIACTIARNNFRDGRGCLVVLRAMLHCVLSRTKRVLLVTAFCSFQYHNLVSPLEVPGQLPVHSHTHPTLRSSLVLCLGGLGAVSPFLPARVPSVRSSTQVSTSSNSRLKIQCQYPSFDKKKRFVSYRKSQCEISSPLHNAS